MIKFFLRLLLRARLHGQPFPADCSRLLIVANHASWLDRLLLALYLPVRPVYIVFPGEARCDWLLRFFPRWAHTQEIDPMQPMSIKTLVRLVESGQPVLIFPEGQATHSISLHKIYEGVAYVAAKTQATVLPIYIAGTYAMGPGVIAQCIRRTPINIRIGSATHLSAGAGNRRHENRPVAVDELRRCMQDVLIEAIHQRTLFQAFVQAMHSRGRRARILADIQKDYRFGELLKMVLALGRLLARQSEPGERVAVLLPNVAANLAVILGLSAMRRIPAMLNYTAGASGMSNACRAAKVRTVITSRAFIETAKLSAAVEQLGEYQVLYLEDLRPTFGWRDKAWLMAYALWFPEAATVKSVAEEPAVVLFTSGSEGKPKGVLLSHANLLFNIAQVQSVIDFLPCEEKFFNALPMFHALGLTGGTLLPILTGTNLVMYTSPLHYHAIPELVYRHGCTVLISTSSFLAQYGRLADPLDFAKLRYVVAGAEKLPERVRLAWFNKFGLRILEGYGATECAPVVSVTTPTYYEAGTVGKLLPGMSMFLEAVPGIEEGGLLHVRGPNVMLGYLLNEQPGVLRPVSSTRGEGWYNTGDVVSVDARGYITVQGRIKRFAKVAGEMISLEVAENVAQQASPGHMHAATSVPHNNRGEAILLFTTDESLERDALVKKARELGLSELTVPRRIVHLGHLPVLGSGKLDYLAIKGMAEAQPLMEQ